MNETLLPLLFVVAHYVLAISATKVMMKFLPASRNRTGSVLAAWIIPYLPSAIILAKALYFWLTTPTTSQSKSVANKNSIEKQSITPSQVDTKQEKAVKHDNLTVFVSYRRSDQIAAALLVSIYDRLTAHFGKDNVFRDIDSVPLGIDFRKYIAQHIQKCDVCVALIGPQWKQLLLEHPDKRRDFVVIELEEALQRDIPVIPVLVGGAQMPSDETLPKELKDLAWRNGLPIDHGRGFDDQVHSLIRGIEFAVMNKKSNQ